MDVVLVIRVGIEITGIEQQLNNSLRYNSAEVVLGFAVIFIYPKM